MLGSPTKTQANTLNVFREHDHRTYYGKRSAKLTGDNWIMNFVLDFKYEVDGDDGEAGVVFDMRTNANPQRVHEVLILNVSWKNNASVRDGIHKGINIPALAILPPNMVMNRYLDWKLTSRSDSQKQAVHRLPVKRLGIQDDKRTLILGPDAMFEIGREPSVILQPGEGIYAWTPHNTQPKDISVHKGEIYYNLLEILQRCLPPETFHTWILMLGHTWMSMGYNLLADVLHGIPAICVVGDANTWKSLSAACCLDFFGQNMLDHCNLRSITLPSLETRWVTKPLPLISHDFKNYKTAVMILECSYEQTIHVNCKTQEKRVKPATSILMTMNYDIFEDTVQAATDRNRLMTRICALEMNIEIADLDDDDTQALKKARNQASGNAEKLVALYAPELMQELVKEINSAKTKMLGILAGFGVTTGVQRAARMWATLLKAGEKVAAALDFDVDKGALLECVKKHARFTSGYQQQVNM
ncbi:uncharacterized protein LOC129595100 [Paramacrobiotus metropolitanus]|uniref:uncharacterized protein LOC129595100 n=1 Tax=Paramacrobiotus metropolitanus TaxID=2943436 RepID=UPI0024462DBC|nr:uncharacterized protein LOC129595100 [Paramacrobiotus metropolitanus]